MNKKLYSKPLFRTVSCPFFLIRYAESVGAAHFHTSAKANRGLDEVFSSLATSK
jgi:hypothetical protein